MSCGNLIKEDISMNLMKTLIKDYIKLLRVIKKNAVSEFEKLIFSGKKITAKHIMKFFKNSNLKLIEKEWNEFEKKYENKIKPGDFKKFAAKYGDSPQIDKLLDSIENVMYGDE